MGNKMFKSASPIDAENSIQFLPKHAHPVLKGQGRYMKTLKCTSDNGNVMVRVFLYQDDGLDIQNHADYLLYVKGNFCLKNQPNVAPFDRYYIEEKIKIAFLCRQFFFCSLSERLSSRPFLTYIEKLWIAFLCLQSLSQLHGAKVCHGDIKAENIVLTSWGWVLMTDFGFYKPALLNEDDNLFSRYTYFFEAQRHHSCCLAPERVVRVLPEVNEEDKYDSNSIVSRDSIPPGRECKMDPSWDIFSLGCVLAELFMEGQELFDFSSVLNFRDGEFDPFPILDRLNNAKLQELIKSMLSRVPNDRFSADRYLTQYTGDNNLFPREFQSELFPLLKQPLLSECRTGDERIAYVCRNYGRILRNILHTESSSREQQFLTLDQSIMSAIHSRSLSHSPSLTQTAKKGLSERRSDSFMSSLRKVTSDYAALGNEGSGGPTSSSSTNPFGDASNPYLLSSPSNKELTRSLSHTLTSAGGDADDDNDDPSYFDEQKRGFSAKSGSTDGTDLFDDGDRTMIFSSQPPTQQKAVKHVRDGVLVSGAVGGSGVNSLTHSLTHSLTSESVNTKLQSLREAIEGVNTSELGSAVNVASTGQSLEVDESMSSEVVGEHEPSMSESALPRIPSPHSQSLLLILPLITSSLTSVKYPVSKLAAIQLLSDFSQYLDDRVILQRVIPFVRTMINVHEVPAVRASAIRELTSLVSRIRSIPASDGRLFPSYIFPAIEAISNMNLNKNLDNYTLLCVAECLPSLSLSSLKVLDLSHSLRSKSQSVIDSGYVSGDYVKDRMEVKEMVLRIVQNIVNRGGCAQVYLGRSLIMKVEQFIEFFGSDSDSFIQFITTFLNISDPCFKVSLIDKCSTICQLLGQSFFDSIQTAIGSFLLSENSVVVAHTLTFLSRQLEVGFIRPERAHDILKFVAPLLLHPSLTIREATVLYVFNLKFVFPEPTVQAVIGAIIQTYYRLSILYMPWSLDSLTSYLYSPLTYPEYEEVVVNAKNMSQNDLIATTDYSTFSSLFGSLDPDTTTKQNIMYSFVRKMEQVSRGEVSRQRSNSSLIHSAADLCGGKQVPAPYSEKEKCDDIETIVLRSTDAPAWSNWSSNSGNQGASGGVSGGVGSGNQTLVSTSSQRTQSTSSASQSLAQSPMHSLTFNLRGGPTLDVDLLESGVYLSEYGISLNKRNGDCDVMDSNELNELKQTLRSLRIPHTQLAYGALPNAPRFGSAREIDERIQDYEKVKCGGKLVSEIVSEGGTSVKAVSSSMDGTFFCWGESDGKIRLFVTSNVLKSDYNGDMLMNTGSSIQDLKIINYTSSVIFCNSHGHVGILNPEYGTYNTLISSPLYDHQMNGRVVSVSVNDADMRSSVVCVTTNQLVTLDLRCNCPSSTLNLPRLFGSATCATMSEGAYWVACGTELGYVSVFDMRYQLPVCAWRVSDESSINGLYRTGKYNGSYEPSVWCSSGDNRVSVFDINNGQSKRTLQTIYVNPKDESSLGELSPSDIPPMPSFIQVDTHKTNQYPIHGKNPAHSITAMYSPLFNYKSGFLITGGGDRRLRFWDLSVPANSFTMSGVDDNSIVHRYSQLNEEVTVCEEPRGVMAGATRTFTGQRVCHSKRITGITMTGVNDKYVVSCGDDGKVLIWK